MSPKKKSKLEQHDASPSKSLGEELATLRRNLHRAFRAYEKKLADDLALVTVWNDSVAQVANPSRAQIRDMGDMLGLLRRLKIKPEKGRRRDLRKVEAVLEDLVTLSREKRID